MTDVDGIGYLVGHGEFWLFRYYSCGHATNFPRDRSIGFGYDEAPVIRAIREQGRESFECSSRVACTPIR
jgi:hypothetical protein